MITLKAGLLYFALVFAAGWVLGPIRELAVVPRFGRTVGVLLEAPLILGVSAWAARWVIRRLAVGFQYKPRFWMGMVALGLLLIAETLGSVLLRGMTLGEYAKNFASASGVIALLSFALFAIMPLLVARK
jgi:hypothetical protein